MKRQTNEWYEAQNSGVEFRAVMVQFLSKLIKVFDSRCRNGIQQKSHDS